MSVLYGRRHNDQIYNSHKKETHTFGRIQQRATVSKTEDNKNAQFFYDNFPPPPEQLPHLPKKGGRWKAEARAAIMELALIDGATRASKSYSNFRRAFVRRCPV